MGEKIEWRLTKKIIQDGQKDMDKKVKEGPKPYDTEFTTRPDKRKVITTETVKNYVSISDEYTNLKQKISINFLNIKLNTNKKDLK